MSSAYVWCFMGPICKALCQCLQLWPLEAYTLRQPNGQADRLGIKLVMGPHTYKIMGMMYSSECRGEACAS